MTISIRQLGRGFAGEVTGVDCRKPLSSGDVAAIHAGMNDYAVLVFRDQKLSDEERVNDLVMWDNRSTMHRGRRFDPNEARDIRQTRLAGDGPTIAQAGG